MDWENELLDGPPVADNPHWQCGTLTSPPCPTGEHTEQWVRGALARRFRDTQRSQQRSAEYRV